MKSARSNVKDDVKEEIEMIENVSHYCPGCFCGCFSSRGESHPKKVWAELGECKNDTTKVSSGTFRSYGIRVMGPTLFL